MELLRGCAMANAKRLPVSEFDIPPSGGAGCVIAVFVFVGSFAALAVYHLANFSETPTMGIVAAVLWLALVTVMLVGGIQAGGLRGTAIHTLGAFSSRQFVEAARDGDRVLFCFGYQLFRRRFYYLRIERDRIVSVDMGTGQATTLAGHDMNDWHVAIWYRDPDQDTQRRRTLGLREERTYIVGPTRPQAPTAQVFMQFVAFLRTTGLELHPTTKENEFRTGDS